MDWSLMAMAVGVSWTLCAPALRISSSLLTVGGNAGANSMPGIRSKVNHF